MSRLGGVKVRGALIGGHIYDPVPVNTARKQMRICLFFSRVDLLLLQSMQTN